MLSCALAITLVFYCVAEVSTPDPLTQLPSCCTFVAARQVHFVADGVSTLILWQAACFVCALAAFLQVHCVAEVSFLILWHSCPCCFALLVPAAVHCVAGSAL
jgi:hypothetical protein